MADIINAIFECFAGLVCIISIRDICKKKAVAGYTILTCSFFWLWGFWNLFYYPHLNQWVSYIGGIGVFITNTVLFGVVLKYRKRKIVSVE